MRRAMNDAIWARVTGRPGLYWPSTGWVMSHHAAQSIGRRWVELAGTSPIADWGTSPGGQAGSIDRASGSGPAGCTRWRVASAPYIGHGTRVGSDTSNAEIVPALPLPGWKIGRAHV